MTFERVVELKGAPQLNQVSDLDHNILVSQSRGRLPLPLELDLKIVFRRISIIVTKLGMITTPMTRTKLTELHCLLCSITPFLDGQKLK